MNTAAASYFGSEQARASRTHLASEANNAGP